MPSTGRNDAMHIGAYARHATEAAIELCIGLEEALIADIERTVGNVMVTSPMTLLRSLRSCRRSNDRKSG